MPNGPPRLTDTRRNIGYGCRSKKEQQQQQQRSNTVSGSAKWWKWMMGSSKLANDCETCHAPMRLYSLAWKFAYVVVLLV
uniref:Homeobox domain-containing protein n=1 Tax=Panagrellus redivivus TaxID=6233 RepID=A0A7E4V5Q7_PANRE